MNWRLSGRVWWLIVPGKKPAGYIVLNRPGRHRCLFSCGRVVLEFSAASVGRAQTMIEYLYRVHSRRGR